MRKICLAIVTAIFISLTGPSIYGQEGVISQKIIFSQPYKFKNSMFSKKLMSGIILEDSATNERLIMLSGNKTLDFYLVNNNWKMLKTFQTSTPKNSAFNNDNFEIVNYSHNSDRWIIITGDYTEFNAEVVDTKDQTHAVAGAVFQDKDKKYSGKTFYDGKRSFNMYPNKSGNITVACVDENAAIKNYPVDLSSQLPLKKSKKLDAKDIYDMYEEIDTVTSQMLWLTRRKVHYYNIPSNYIFTISHEEPVTEVIFYDKNNWKRTKSELFSVEDLLPEVEKNAKLNTSSLIYDSKVWVFSVYKDGGVLGVFDITTKKLIYNLKIDYNTPKSQFAYGPVMYKAVPSSGKIFSGEYNIKDKVEDISLETYIKELFKRDIGLYLHHYSENEYAVSFGSYSMMNFQTPGASNRPGISSMSDPGIYESAVAGLVFKKNESNPVSRNTDYNEVNYSDASAKYAVQKIEKKVNQAPEYNDRGAIVIKEQVIKNRVYTLYYMDEMFKIFEKVTEFDLSKFGLKF